jgi:hypothetical protein
MSIQETIQCRYSCEGCGLFRVAVNVRARTTEDVVEWFEKVLTPALSNDHTQRSPHCTSRMMKEVLVPLENPNKTMEADQVGGTLHPKKVQ